jgi:hypothetical protein
MSHRLRRPTDALDVGHSCAVGGHELEDVSGGDSLRKRIGEGEQDALAIAYRDSSLSATPDHVVGTLELRETVLHHAKDRAGIGAARDTLLDAVDEHRGGEALALRAVDEGEGSLTLLRAESTLVEKRA